MLEEHRDSASSAGIVAESPLGRAAIELAVRGEAIVLSFFEIGVFFTTRHAGHVARVTTLWCAFSNSLSKSSNPDYSWRP